MTVLACSGLEKRFGHGPRAVAALRGVDLAVAAGEVVAVVGESGSGKTTLGKAALFVDPPTAGEVRWADLDPRRLSPRALREARRRYQLVYQNPFASLNPGLTLREHLVETARVHLGLRGAAALDVADGALARLSLLRRADARPASLSGGEKRRATVARALLPRPDLIVADEPTSGLDAAVKTEVLGSIVAAREARTAVVLITHDLEVVRPLADRLVVMYHGRVVEEVPGADVGTRDHHPYTAALLAAARWERPDGPPGCTAPAPSGRMGGGEAGDGCAFLPRCPRAAAAGDAARSCLDRHPELRNAAPGQRVACHLAPPAGRAEGGKEPTPWPR